MVRLLTPAAVVEKIAYVLANPVAAGLVRHAKEWPGAKVDVGELGRGVLHATRPAAYLDPENPQWVDEATLPLALPPAIEQENAEGFRRQVAAELQHPAQRRAIFGALATQAGRTLEQICRLVDPRQVCVENLEDALFDLALPLVERFGTSICLDVGHLFWSGADPLEFLTNHGTKIREVHLHDAVGPSDETPGGYRDHMALGQGALDYNAFLGTLAASGFDGAIILELNTAQDLESSLERIRRI